MYSTFHKKTQLEVLYNKKVQGFKIQHFKCLKSITIKFINYSEHI